MTKETVPDVHKSLSPFEVSDGDRHFKLAALKAAVLGVPGLRLAGYSDLAPVGEGGMGVVYRGVDAHSGGPVALKLLRHDDPKGASRFEREVATLQTLRHPQVVSYLDHGSTTTGRRFLVMEWLDGLDAAEWSARHEVRYLDVIDIGLAAARGLGHAHDQGVVHRDVKPSNLFLLDEQPSHTKVIDFGVAKVFAASDSLTSTGALLGTPAYVAPEQLEGRASATADVYGLGATLFELATGVLPIRSSSTSSLLLDVLRVIPPNACTLRPSLPRSFGALLAAMLAKDPDCRPADMRVVALELEELRDELTRGARRVNAPEPGRLVERDDSPQEHPFGPIPFVGREAELGRILALLDACIAEEGAGWVVVEGAYGSGKSALLGRCLEVLREREVSAVLCSAQAGAAAVPFETAAQIAEAMTVQGWLSTAEHQTLRARFDAVRSGLQVPGQAAGTQLDALHGQWRDALDTIDWSAPRALVIDALDRVDAPSMRLLSALLRRAHAACVVLVASATVADGVCAQLELHEGLAQDRILLAPVRTRALHRALFEAGLRDPQARTRCIQQSDGSIGRLVAARGVWSDGTTEAAGTTDFDGMVLRALAVQQPSCTGLLAAILGIREDSPLLGSALERAVDQGAVRQNQVGRFEGQPELWLSEPGISGGQGALGPEAHRACADWMDAVGGFSPEVRLPHYRACGDRARRSGAALQAATTAHAVDDIAAVETFLNDVDESVLEPSQRRVWSRLVFASHMGNNRIEDALAAIDDALERTPTRGADWYGLFAERITALGQAGRNPEVAQSEAQLGPAPGDDGEVRELWLIATARIASQLATWNPSIFLRLVDTIEPVFQRAPASAQVRGVCLGLRGLYDMRLSFAQRLGRLDEARDAYMLAGDRRTAAMVRMFWGVGQVRLGGWRHAREAFDDALEVFDRLGVGYLHAWALYSRARLLVELDPQRAVPELESVRGYFQSSPRLRSGALLYEGWARLRLEQPHAAVAAARLGAQAHDTDEIQAGAAAIMLLASNRGANVPDLPQQREAAKTGLSAPQLLEFAAHARYALAEDARVRADPAYRVLIAEARDELLAELGEITDPAQRSAAWHGPWLHRAIMQAAESLGLSGESRTAP
ncbi:MAG: protein kinase domain-containing protein [Nannocystales bacterium]